MTATLVFGWRALLKIKHVPEQLADVIGMPILFTVMFTYLFGGALAGSTARYLQFLLPGVLTLAVVFLTVYSGVTLNRDLGSGAYDRFRSLPIWRPAPIVGGLLGDAGRYLIAAVLVLVLGFAMGFHADGGPGGIVAGVALAVAFAVSFSWVWITVGLLVRTPNAVMSIGFTLLFPFTFITNTFVDPNTMPAGLHTAADINPISHLVTAERQLIQGISADRQIIWVLVSCAALTLVFAPAATRLYRNRR